MMLMIIVKIFNFILVLFQKLTTPLMIPFGTTKVLLVSTINLYFILFKRSKNLIAFKKSYLNVSFLFLQWKKNV